MDAEQTRADQTRQRQHRIAGMGKYTYSLDCISLLFRHMDLLRTRRQLLLLEIFTEQLQELFLVLPDELRDLRVACGHLLQDRFEHCRVLLHQLAKLLEMGVVAQEIQILPFASGRSTRASSASSSLAGLRCRFEEVHRFLSTGGGRCSRCSATGRCSRGRRRRGSGRVRLLLPNSVGNALTVYQQQLPKSPRPCHTIHTFNRYSMARLGLKKAARMARLISSLAKPIDSI